MRIIRQVSWTYTLFEDGGLYVLELVIPATADVGWVNYEKKIVLSAYEKLLIKIFPSRVDYLANILINKEKQAQLRQE